MTDPIQRSPVRPPTSHEPPPIPTGHAAPGPVLQLLDGVDHAPPARGELCESPTEALRRRSVDQAVDALVQGDHVRFDDLVRNDTRILGSLGRLSEDVLERRIGAAFERSHTGLVDRLGGNYFATMRAVGRAADRVQSAFREMVRNEAKTAVEDLTRRLDTLDPQAIVQTLRDAEPGTREHSLAQALGVFGERGDEERVAGEIDAIVQSLRTFRSHLIGNTWEPSDLPESSSRVLCRLGLGEAPEGSLFEAAIEGHRPTNDRGHDVVLAVDAGVSAYEVVHALAHGAAAPAAIAVGGLALGLAIHHAIDENVENRRALAREIGL